MECSKFHWPAVAGLKEQSSTRLVKEYNSCHFKNTATRHFFLLLQFLLINAIWHVESKKTLGTRLILMSSLSKFVKFFFQKKKYMMLPRTNARLATGTILVATRGATFPAFFALSLNVPMVHSAVLLNRSQSRLPFSKH